jgi:hypothetical protein
MIDEYGTVMKFLKGLVEKPEEKRSLERPKHRWDNIKMDIAKAGCEDADSIYQLTQDTIHCRTFVYTVMNLRILSKHRIPSPSEY